MNTKLLQDILYKKMSRREFLAYIGAALLAMTGITALLKSLTKGSFKSNESILDYGGGPYGGVSQ